MSGSSAALRVAFKNARRNKKRTFYLVLLIALPVMVAATTSSLVRLGQVSPEERASSEFGAGNVLITQQIPRVGTPPVLTAWLDGLIAEQAAGADSLSRRTYYMSFAEGEFGDATDLDLSAPLSRGILTLVEGRAAARPDEVVLTEHLAEVLGSGIGADVSFQDFDGTYRVVGLASHPVLWGVNEVVFSPDGLDMFLHDRPDGPTSAVILSVTDDMAFTTTFWEVWERDRYQFYPKDREWPMPEPYQFMWEGTYAAMSDDQLKEVDRLLAEEGVDAALAYADGLFLQGIPSDRLPPEIYAESRSERLSWDRTNLVQTGPVVGTGVAALILAEVAFIAGAAFATGTRRRLREIGLMGANGASTKHVRSTVVGEGLLVGLVGGILGSTIAFVMITLGRSQVQQFVERRIDGFPFSILDILGPIALAVISCVIAAWVPARTAAGVPTLTALQGRMPVGAPKRWVIPAGLSLGALGVLLLGVGFAGNDGSAGVVAVLGAVLMIGGTALLAGPLVAWISGHAERFPVNSRVVLRDSGRQRGRAAAAVAATMVIMMAPIAIMTQLAQSEASQAVDGLAPTRPQVHVYGAESATGEVLPLEDSDLADIEAAMPNSRVVVFDAVDVPIWYPAELTAGDQLPIDAPEGASIVGDSGQVYQTPFRMLIANTELLALFDDSRLSTALSRDGIAVIGVEERETTIEIDGERLTVSEIPIGVPRWDFPRVVVTAGYAEGFPEADVRRSALVEIDETWLQSINPLAEPARPLWNLGLFTSGGGADISARSAFTLVFLATMLVVLIVVATITALSAAEADNDLQTIVAVGATNSIRRRYLGLQSGMHTLLGCALAVPLTLLLLRTAYSSALGSYVQIGAFGVFDSSRLFVPWLGIGVLVVALPLAIGSITAISVRSAPTTPPTRAT